MPMLLLLTASLWAVISKHLVTFSNIQEIQTNNQKLLALVRELSKKAEKEEMEGKEGYSELKAVVQAQETELADIKEREKRLTKMMERAMRQLNMYKDMILRSKGGAHEVSFADESDGDSPETEPSDSAAGTPSKNAMAADDNQNKQIKELTEKLQEAERSLRELQEETNSYCMDRQTNERILTEQMETTRTELRELRMSSSVQLVYSEERFKIMQANCNTYKTQIAALEGKNKTYNNTIVKHLQTIVHLQEELLCEQKKLARAEVCLENAKRECALLQETEARLQRDCEAQRREQHGQALLLANLDTIRASLEHTEAEGRARLESRLDESLRECAALRRRLQEEQDRFRELSKDLTRQADTAKARLEERELVARGKSELDSVKEELQKAKNKLISLNKRTKDSMDNTVTLERQQELEGIEKRVRDLQAQLRNERSELTRMMELLEMEKSHSKQFCEVSESLEARLSETLVESDRYKAASEKRLTEVMKTEEELRRKVAALESQLSLLQTGSSQSSAQLNVQLTKVQEEKQVLEKELDQARHEVASLSGALQAADKYAHEVVLHSDDLQNWLTDLEIFAALVAALVHDFEHTGTTNNFHVMSGSDTALLYNDRAVLENHHVSAAFRLLRDDDCNILQNLSREEFREFRSLVIDTVLATDMSFHFQQLKNMRGLLSLPEPSVDKAKTLSLVLHCCDIAHPAKRWDLHRRWTAQLLEEFFRQGDRERELGLPFSPLCDRNSTLVAESQIGFIEFIVEPSMAVCSDMLETVLGPLLGSGSGSGSGASGSGSGTTQTPAIAEEAAEGGESTTASGAPRYRFEKPWTACLAENKRIWKEQAARDAEARARASAAEAENKQEGEEGPDS